MTPKLEIKNVSKFFGDTQVLNDVDFSIGDGEFVSIVGTSGCGKTTLLRIVAGLDHPTGGEVVLDGQPVEEPTRKIGIAFQSDRLLPWRTVRKNVTFGLELGKAEGKIDSDRIDALIDLVGLADFTKFYPYQLSGGMKQRVNLARALAVDPEVLLLDEPFAALDAQTRELMQLELLRIWGEQKKTVYFITHQIDEAVFLSDRVIVLERRPGHVRDIIEIDLDRPRDLSIKRTKKFNEYVEQIWSLLERDVRNADMETNNTIRARNV
jgi:ABC-type nitrate/sulfonate/bicarbonate transport system, ATPase component